MFLDGVRRVGGGAGGFTGGGGDGGSFALGVRLGARRANVHTAARAFARWANERWTPRDGRIHERASKLHVDDEFGAGDGVEVGIEGERGWTVPVDVDRGV